MSNDTLTYIVRNLKEEQLSISAHLADGGASDYAEYRFLVGKLRGLLTAQAIAEDLAKRLEMLNE